MSGCTHSSCKRAPILAGGWLNPLVIRRVGVMPPQGRAGDVCDSILPCLVPLHTACSTAGLEATTYQREAFSRSLPPQGGTRSASKTRPDLAKDLFPRDAERTVRSDITVELVGPPIDFRPLGVGQRYVRGDPAQAIPELADEVELLAGRQAFYINRPLRHVWILLPIPLSRNGSLPNTEISAEGRAASPLRTS